MLMCSRGVTIAHIHQHLLLLPAAHLGAGCVVAVCTWLCHGCVPLPHFSRLTPIAPSPRPEPLFTAPHCAGLCDVGGLGSCSGGFGPGVVGAAPHQQPDHPPASGPLPLTQELVGFMGLVRQ